MVAEFIRPRNRERKCHHETTRKWECLEQPHQTGWPFSLWPVVSGWAVFLLIFFFFFAVMQAFATSGLSLIVVSRAALFSRASHGGGFFCCTAQAPGVQAPVVAPCGLRSCGSWALEHRLLSCGPQVQWLCSTWDVPGSGLKPGFPALASGLLTTRLPGKPTVAILILIIQVVICQFPG